MEVDGRKCSVWRGGRVPQLCNFDETINVLHKKKDNTQSMWQISWGLPVAHAMRNTPQKDIASRLSDYYCERGGILPEEQGGATWTRAMHIYFIL